MATSLHMPAAIEDDSVLVSQHDAILHVRLNRPEKRNAMRAAMAERISAAMDRLDETEALRVGLLSAEGPVFCAGLDLKAFATGDKGRSQTRGFGGVTRQPPRKPLVVAVEGGAFGGGFEIVLACDLIVASETATFALPEVRRGQLATAGGLLRLPLRIPHHKAMEIILLGRDLSAPEAHALGLVNRLAPPGGALDLARQMAEAVAANAPLATAGAKEVVTRSRDWSREEAFARQEEIADPIRRSADALEGARAFTEKRQPVWQGR